MEKINRNLPDKLRLKFRKSNTKMIQIDNGTMFRIKSSNAAESSRGFTTDAVLDEFALVGKSTNLMNAAGSATVRGLGLTIISTPFGRSNDYYRIIKDTSFNTEKIYGSITEYLQKQKEGKLLLKEGYFPAKTGQEAKLMMYDWVRKETDPIIKKDIALFDKEYDRVKKNNMSDYSIHIVPWFTVPDMDWPFIMSIGLTYEGLLQEYFLSFLDAASSMLSLDEITKCAIVEPKSLGLQTQPYVDRAIFCGVDPSSGRVNETAWMFLAEPIWDKDGVLIDPWRVLWYETTWDRRHRYIKRLAKQINHFKPSKVYIDEPGIGIAVIEDLEELGIVEPVVEGIKAGNAIRETITWNAVTLIQSELVMLPDDPRFIDQAFSLGKEKTSTGKYRFTGKINSTDGQDDLWWAYAFAVSIGNIKPRSAYRMDDIEIGSIDIKVDKNFVKEKEQVYL